MPIYAYRCTACGHAQDVLQKISDDVLTVCPACGAASFAKQVTAAGFQLKGSGWYVTDFRGGNSRRQGSREGRCRRRREGCGPARRGRCRQGRCAGRRQGAGRCAGQGRRSGQAGRCSRAGPAAPKTGA